MFRVVKVTDSVDKCIFTDDGDDDEAAAAELVMVANLHFQLSWYN